MRATKSPKPSLGDVIQAVARPRARILVLTPTRALRPDKAHPPLYPPGHHTFYELAICFEGAMSVVADAGTLDLRAGDAVVIQPGAWHYESYRRVRQPYRMCWLMATPGLFSCIFTRYERARFQNALDCARPSVDEADRLQQIVREVRDRPAHWQLQARAALIALLVEFDRRLAEDGRVPALPSVDPVRKLLHIIQTRFREPLQLNGLARELGLSADHLSRRFHAACRTTFKDYLNGVRIHHAQHLLKSGWSIKRTADDCGFRDVYYFNRVFKQRSQTTPGKYLHSLR